MSRPCSSCGMRSCDGIECYLADPEAEREEGDTGITLAELRAKYGDGGTDPLRSIEPTILAHIRAVPLLKRDAA